MPQQHPPTIYLAGPDIFFPDAIEIGARKKSLCRQYGFTGLYPLDMQLADQPTPPATAIAIYQADVAMMDQADAIIANLSPFRSPSADPGTVFELAWMIARGRPAFGYSTDPRGLRERTIAAVRNARAHPETGRWHDADGLELEDFGLHENLMIDCALQAGGTPLVTPPAGSEHPDLWGFEQCLVAAQARLLA